MRFNQPIYVEYAQLERFATALFVRSGLAPEGASLVSRCLVMADLRGVDSHGVTRIPIYVKRLEKGLVNPHPQVRAERVSASVCLVDGDNGMGALVGTRAMEQALSMAGEAGVGVAAVRRSNHYGMAAFYALQALDRGCIGMTMTNAPPTLAPWGGRQALLGTNPLAVAVPAGQHPPIVLDMATSVVARGKIILAAQRGEPIPEGWALDPDGAPTTDARRALAGVVLPFGGPKGSGLAILVDILAGVLTGAAFGRRIGDLYRNFEQAQDVGHFFLALNIATFMPVAEFLRRMDEMIADLKRCAPASGHTEVLLPGEPEARCEAERRRTGIPLSSDVAAALYDVGERLDVPFPEFSGRPIESAPDTTRERP
ncbi:MAG: Ldh family oxidoreductase [Bacillota bacterium]